METKDYKLMEVNHRAVNLDDLEALKKVFKIEKKEEVKK